MQGSPGRAALPLRPPSTQVSRRGPVRMLLVLAGALCLAMAASSDANPREPVAGSRPASLLSPAAAAGGASGSLQASASTPGGEAGGYGPSGRYELNGSWLFRFDYGAGLKRHFESSTSTPGWSTVTVPHAWNATDQSAASMTGTVTSAVRDTITNAMLMTRLKTIAISNAASQILFARRKIMMG